MKAGADWYPRYPQSFLMGCMGLSTKEIAVYQIAVDLMYANAGECPNEPKFIAGYISDMGPASVRKTIESLIEKGKIFITENERLSNETVQNLAKTRAETRDKRIISGKKGGKKSAEIRAASKEINDLAESSASTTIQPENTRVDKSVIGKPITPPTPKGELAGLGKEFERMWGFYPRKVGKGNAKKAFIKARAKASLEEIAHGMKSFVDNINGTPIDKIPHAATWLNQERWLDDQTHAANRGRTSEDDMRSLGAATAADDMGSLFGAEQLSVETNQGERHE